LSFLDVKEMKTVQQTKMRMKAAAAKKTKRVMLWVSLLGIIIKDSAGIQRSSTQDQEQSNGNEPILPRGNPEETNWSSGSFPKQGYLPVCTTHSISEGTGYSSGFGDYFINFERPI
jgi:hypothetical protein